MLNYSTHHHTVRLRYHSTAPGTYVKDNNHDFKAFELNVGHIVLILL
jgi:hypothetical protein